MKHIVFIAPGVPVFASSELDPKWFYWLPLRIPQKSEKHVVILEFVPREVYDVDEALHIIQNLADEASVVCVVCPKAQGSSKLQTGFENLATALRSKVTAHNIFHVDWVPLPEAPRSHKLIQNVSLTNPASQHESQARSPSPQGDAQSRKRKDGSRTPPPSPPLPSKNHRPTEDKPARDDLDPDLEPDGKYHERKRAENDGNKKGKEQGLEGKGKGQEDKGKGKKGKGKGPGGKGNGPGGKGNGHSAPAQPLLKEKDVAPEETEQMPKDPLTNDPNNPLGQGALSPTTNPAATPRKRRANSPTAIPRERVNPRRAASQQKNSSKDGKPSSSGGRSLDQGNPLDNKPVLNPLRVYFLLPPCPPGFFDDAAAICTQLHLDPAHLGTDVVPVVLGSDDTTKTTDEVLKELEARIAAAGRPAHVIIGIEDSSDADEVFFDSFVVAVCQRFVRVKEEQVRAHLEVVRAQALAFPVDLDEYAVPCDGSQWGKVSLFFVPSESQIHDKKQKSKK